MKSPSSTTTKSSVALTDENGTKMSPSLLLSSFITSTCTLGLSSTKWISSPVRTSNTRSLTMPRFFPDLLITDFPTIFVESVRSAIMVLFMVAFINSFLCVSSDC